MRWKGKKKKGVTLTCAKMSESFNVARPGHVTTRQTLSFHVLNKVTFDCLSAIKSFVVNRRQQF